MRPAGEGELEILQDQHAGPSPITTPSRALSNGRGSRHADRPELVEAGDPEEADRRVGPPASMMVAAPRRMSSAAWPMLSLPVAQAETGENDGPCAPTWIETAAVAPLVMIIGMLNGLSARWPRARSSSAWRSIVSKPPTAEPTTTPVTAASSGSITNSASRRAWTAAPTAYCSNRSLRRADRASM
jgi:hypothetical protein